MRNRAIALCVMSLLVAARAEAQFRVEEPAAGEDFHFEAGLMFWTPTPNVVVQTGSLAALGQPPVDFVGEFGIERTRFNEFRGVIKAGRKHKVRVSHIAMEYSKAATLQRTINFGGSTFPVDVPATADLKWEFWRLGYEWDFVANPRGLLGMITELKINKVSASLAH